MSDFEEWFEDDSSILRFRFPLEMRRAQRRPPRILDLRADDAVEWPDTFKLSESLLITLEDATATMLALAAGANIPVRSPLAARRGVTRPRKLPLLANKPMSSLLLARPGVIR